MHIPTRQYANCIMLHPHSGTYNSSLLLIGSNLDPSAILQALCDLVLLSALKLPIVISKLPFLIIPLIEHGSPVAITLPSCLCCSFLLKSPPLPPIIQMNLFFTFPPRPFLICEVFPIITIHITSNFSFLEVISL